jgi:hypothetical protein
MVHRISFPSYKSKQLSLIKFKNIRYFDAKIKIINHETTSD